MVARRSALDVTLLLLESGADYRRTYYQGWVKLTHELVMQEREKIKWWTNQEKNNFHAVAQWLESHGESIEAARKDIASGKMKSPPPPKDEIRALK